MDRRYTSACLLLGAATRLFASSPVINSAELKDDYSLFSGPTLEISFRDDAPIPYEHIRLYRVSNGEKTLLLPKKTPNGVTRGAYATKGEPFSIFISFHQLHDERSDNNGGQYTKFIDSLLERDVILCYDIPESARAGTYVAELEDQEGNTIEYLVKNSLRSEIVPKTGLPPSRGYMDRTSELAIRKHVLDTISRAQSRIPMRIRTRR